MSLPLSVHCRLNQLKQSTKKPIENEPDDIDHPPATRCDSLQHIPWVASKQHSNPSPPPHIISKDQIQSLSAGNSKLGHNVTSTKNNMPERPPQLQHCPSPFKISINDSRDDMMVFLNQTGKEGSGHSLTVVDLSQSLLPPQLGGRAKYVHASYNKTSLQTFTIGPDSFSGPLKVVGRGTYGYAVKGNMKTRPKSSSSSQYLPPNRSVVLKVDHRLKHLTWEVVVHQKIQSRLKSDLSRLTKASMANMATYRNNFLPPFALYSFENATVAAMGFGNLGTLFDFGRKLNLGKSVFCPFELELLSAYFAKQMVDVLLLLHHIQISHYDMKNDNWVLASEDGDSRVPTFKSNKAQPCLRLCLIDFGLSRDLSLLSSASDEKVDSLKRDFDSVAECIFNLLYHHDQSFSISSQSLDEARSLCSA